MIKTGNKSAGGSAKIKWSQIRQSTLYREKWLVLLCGLSLFSSFADMPLASLAFVLVQLCKGNGAKYMSVAVSVVYFLSTVTRTAFYIPYIAFAFIYIVADYLLENQRLRPVYPAVLVFLFTKIYVLSFGYEAVHWVFFAGEIALIIFAPDSMVTGLDILKNNEDCTSGQNIAEVLCTLMICALALDGIKMWGIKFSSAFLLTAACYYGKKYNFSLSFAAFFLMLITLTQHHNFAIVAVGFAAIYFGGICLLDKGVKGYIGYIAVSVGVTMLTITRFNSFVFVSTTALSAAGSMCGDKLLDTKTKAIAAESELLGEKDYYELKNKLEKLNRCFRFLGHTVIDISNLMAREYIPTQLEDAVADEVCRKCKNNTFCWQQNYSRTQKQFLVYSQYVQKNIPKDFDSAFYEICDKTEQIKQSFEQHNQLNVTQKLIHSQSMHNQKILQNQFLSMANILQEITYQSNLSGVANAAFTHKANSFLSLMGKKVNYCICYQDKNRCVVSTRQLFSADESYRFKAKLESIYGSKFNLPTKDSDGENTVYTFVQVPMFSCDFGHKSISRFKNCGDVWEYFTADECAYVILADGMGTGSFAAAEGKTASVMLKSLLTASVKTETALELVNTALNLKGTGQSCVAVDILRINLYNGNCSLYKAGAAPSVIADSRKCEFIYKDSLPVGILKEVKTAVINFVMNNGDTVLLATDGINLTEKDAAKIRLINEKCSAQNIAEYIMKNADTADDATAAVIKLIRT